MTALAKTWGAPALLVIAGWAMTRAGEPWDIPGVAFAIAGMLWLFVTLLAVFGMKMPWQK